MKILHLRDDRNVPYGTVVTEGNYAGVSFCSPKDRFNKNLGIKIAAGRMQKAIAKNIPILPEKCPNRFVDGYTEVSEDVEFAVASLQNRPAYVEYRSFIIQ